MFLCFQLCLSWIYSLYVEHARVKWRRQSPRNFIAAPNDFYIPSAPHRQSTFRCKLFLASVHDSFILCCSRARKKSTFAVSESASDWLFWWCQPIRMRLKTPVIMRLYVPSRSHNKMILRGKKRRDLMDFLLSHLELMWFGAFSFFSRQLALSCQAPMPKPMFEG